MYSWSNLQGWSLKFTGGLSISKLLRNLVSWEGVWDFREKSAASQFCLWMRLCISSVGWIRALLNSSVLATFSCSLGTRTLESYSPIVDCFGGSWTRFYIASSRMNLGLVPKVLLGNSVSRVLNFLPYKLPSKVLLDFRSPVIFSSSTFPKPRLVLWHNSLIS